MHATGAAVGDTVKVKSEGRVDVGRLVDSSQADDRRMIRLVRERRLLYARNNMPVASYYTQVKCLWEEVAHEMGWSVADVRRKWSHIRNSYSRHLRNEMHGTRTGKGRMVSKWYLADELEFLRDHMATDMRPSPYSTYAPTFLEMDMGENCEPGDVKPFASPWLTINPATQTPKFEPKFEHHDDSSGSAFGPEENSSYFQFFRGIYNDFQELSPKNQRLFKRQCLSYLHKLLDEEEGDGGGMGEVQAVMTSYDQNDAINLSNSGHGSDEDREDKVCITDSYSIAPFSS